MDLFQVVLIIATLLCTLVAGVVFAFAVVIMPGIRTLGDGEFLRAFQVIDRVIQDGQPAFMLVWVGSVVALLVSAALGLGQLDGTGRILMITAVVVYLLGVQLPTVTINIPLNNAVQTLVVAEMDGSALEEARNAFESRWIFSNLARTYLATLASGLLLILLLGL